MRRKKGGERSQRTEFEERRGRRKEKREEKRGEKREEG
jgi:hypothetical protein